ncbi:MAG: glycosyltransferase [Candidatus Liptonbacteria bacterium]|nr:glycosyltransferase [Candidatus Liptonbacteria bacterium]
MKEELPSNKILYLGTFPPRECGIATFTNDLTTAMDLKFNPQTKSEITAINDDSATIYNYNQKVSNQIAASDIENYVSLAEKINARDEIRVVNIQHEFGIFGGAWGDYLIPFLQVIKKPVVTTFHSVLPEPDDYLKNVVKIITSKSAAVVVMNEFSRDLLVNTYGAQGSKIHLIPHGIPGTAFEPSEKYKSGLGFEGKIVISTFGLLSPGKGIQYAIRALPKILARFPNTVYLVLGETHPNVRRDCGEEYRNYLHELVEDLNLNDHVKFYNKYLTLEEIVSYLKATDVYVSPSVTESQSVSGTLSYAMGCGRPAVSTKTNYAKFLINKNTGILVGFKNSDSIARAVIEILDDPKMMTAMAGEAYETTRKMIWPNVATAYFGIYKKLANLGAEEKKLPPIKLDHLKRLTDDLGIFHFAKYSKPEKRFGYSLDDNARALLVAVMHYRKNPEPEILELIKTYLKFIRFVQRPTGNFANIVSSKRRRDGTNDDDVQGRAIWALGYTSAENILPQEIRRQAQQIFLKSVKRAKEMKSPRAIAFAISGLYAYLKHFPRKNLMTLFKKLSEEQVRLYREVAVPEWLWFEHHFSYSNSKMPESLFYAYDLTKNKKYLEVAEKSLEFLSQITFESNHYTPIGQNGWYFRNKKRSFFDQQPEDTASMVQTKAVAYQVTGREKHLEDAFRAFQWFLGKNHLGQMVYDEVTGGCYDGVGKSALNLNQGAESTISYLLARLALEEFGTNK